MDLLRTIDGKCVGFTEEGLIHGNVAFPTLELEDVEIHWSGAKIPDSLILEFLSLSIDVYENYGGEVQGRLYYDINKKDWRTVIQKQFISKTLFSEETGKDGDIEESMSQLPEGNYVYMGTCHSHCNVNPRPSAIDEKNEKKQNGIHFTVGCIDKDEYLINVRASFRGLNYDMTELGTDCDVLNESLSMSTADRQEYPAFWWECIIPAPVVIPTIQKSNKALGRIAQLRSGRVLNGFDQNNIDSVVGLISYLFPNSTIDSVCRAIEQQQLQLNFINKIEEYEDGDTYFGEDFFS